MLRHASCRDSRVPPALEETRVRLCSALLQPCALCSWPLYSRDALGHTARRTALTPFRSRTCLRRDSLQRAVSSLHPATLQQLPQLPQRFTPPACEQVPRAAASAQLLHPQLHRPSPRSSSSAEVHPRSPRECPRLGLVKILKKHDKRVAGAAGGGGWRPISDHLGRSRVISGDRRREEAAGGQAAADGARAHPSAFAARRGAGGVSAHLWPL